ncbi:Serine-pyruvate aminotransferase [Rubrobacter xylanophilus DSM 9941]|uniref:pyridoxal-phosphate-dependent aminotransferase family protein n=1 Tax=Rubrobacter xylanophilus TaxID=49319 RepID=UPI001C63BECD|nr:alanine--glyoxylate aminotransferase family protein [Rubrobacter xylanophilus]QYJ17037.1 Serine-pyruvate aminotransferase [Rubrobacter xylanophilus DSM 9941]
MQNKYRLMSPGPTPIPPEVSAAGALPIIHHRTPEFGEVFTRVNENLKRVFLTENDIFTYAASGTGSFEGALQNLFSPGDRVLVVNNGNFGGRWVKMSRAFGLEVTELTYEWGQKADNDEVAEALAADPQIKGAICVLSETSTGTVNDIRGFAKATENVLTIVDAVSGLGACELRTDEWGVDVVVAGSQKALMTPPGLGFVSVSERAWRAHEEARLPRYYFDWTAARKAYRKDPPQTPWTPAVSVIIQLDLALQQILEEGLENVLERHVLLGRAARAGVKGMGLRLFGPDEDMNTAVTAAWVPEGIDGKQLVRMVFREHGIQVAGGQGPMEGRIFRIGHCGYFDAYDIIATVAALELALESLGHPVELGRGVGAAQRVFSKSGVTA